MRKTRKDKKIEFYLTFIIFNYLFNIYIFMIPDQARLIMMK
jgi:hypothetical protein